MTVFGIVSLTTVVVLIGVILAEHFIDYSLGDAAFDYVVNPVVNFVKKLFGFSKKVESTVVADAKAVEARVSTDTKVVENTVKKL